MIFHAKSVSNVQRSTESTGKRFSHSCWVEQSDKNLKKQKKQKVRYAFRVYGATQGFEVGSVRASENFRCHSLPR